jgi:hypothetical protein
MVPVILTLCPPRKIKGPSKDGSTQHTVVLAGNEEKITKLKAKYADWFKKNAQALAEITEATQSELMYLVKCCDTAKDIWDNLKATLQPANATRSITLVQQISGYCFHSHYNIGKWLNNLERLRDSLCDIDPNAMSGQEYAQIIINNMPIGHSWHNFVAWLRCQYNDDLQKMNYHQIINAI